MFKMKRKRNPVFSKGRSPLSVVRPSLTAMLRLSCSRV